MSEDQANPREPPWADAAAWGLSAMLVALLGLAFARADTWTEMHTIAWASALFAVFGVAFLLAARSPDRPLLFRYLMRVVRRQRWLKLSRLVTNGDPSRAGWLCLAIALLLTVFNFGV